MIRFGCFNLAQSSVQIPVGPAPQRPSSVGIGAVVHVAALAEEAFAAEGLDVDRHTVADLYAAHLRPDRFDDADHFVADGDALDGARHAAVFDMQIAGTDATERNPYDGIARIEQPGLLFFAEFEPSAFNIGIGSHYRFTLA